MICAQGLELIKERRSIKNYSEEQLTEEELNELLYVAQNSPSAHNKQLYHFTVLQDQEFIAEIAETIRQNMLNSGDEKKIEKASKPGYSPLHHAPTVIFISGDLESGFNVQTDCGIAIGLLIAAAQQMGLQTCMTGSSLFMFKGESGAELKKRLGIPENYQAVGGLAIGHIKGNAPGPVDRKEGLVNIIR